MRLKRILGAAAAVAALALPASPAHAVNTLAYTFTLDCATGSATTGSGVTLPSGRYLVTVAGVCSFTHDTASHSVPVATCGFSPVGSLPCLEQVTAIGNVPGTVCVVGASAAVVGTCSGWNRGVSVPPCGAMLTVVVDEQCLTTVPNAVGVVNHTGGSMTARVLDSGYYNNLGTFTITAVWTPL